MEQKKEITNLMKSSEQKSLEDSKNEKNSLIYGKNDLQRIVNIEIENDKVTCYHEDSNGNVSSSSHSNKYWILADRAKDSSWSKLAGNLHYQYGKQYTVREDWSKANYFLKKAGIDTYVVWDDKEAHMVRTGMTYFKGMKHSDLSVLSFDIESTGLYHNVDSRVLLISNTFRKNGQVTRKLFSYDEYESQGKMVDAWCEWIREVDPSVIIGHNIYSFDFPYLAYIAEREGTSLKLGRDDSDLKINKKASYKRIDGSREQEYHKVRCFGREIIDTMFLAITYDVATKKYDSYGLKAIIKTEGLEKEDRTFYDSSTIRFNYTKPEEWAKIKEYCKDDSDDSLKLYDLMIPAFFYTTQSVPKSFQAILESAPGSQINSLLVRSYVQEGHSIPKASKIHAYEGAISAGYPGIYRNVFKVDAKSMYPSIILQYDVYDEDKDPNANFLKMMQFFTDYRFINKSLAEKTGDHYYTALEQTAKIFINSGYGFMAAEGLNFNCAEAAEFITKTGRDIITTTMNWAKEKNFTIANVDTDSISFTNSDQSEITPEEQKALLVDLNSRFPEKIIFANDGYFKKVIIFKAKNYVLWDGKKIKYKGSAIKASTKCPALKEFIKTTIDYMINDKTDYIELYNGYVKEINNIQDIKRWASRKTVSEKTLTSERTNEARIRDVIQGTEIVEGERIWTFWKSKDEMELVDRFNGEYDKDRLYKSLYDTSQVFDGVLDTDSLFLNYKLKREKAKLLEILA